MKQKDLPLVLVVVFAAAILSLVVSQLIIVPKKTKIQKAQVVPAISSDFQQPDKNVFNPNAINPTQLIQVGNGSNTKPF